MSNLSEVTPITISQLADFILGKEATTGQDFVDAKLPMMGGCENCGASIACYNACPSKSGNLRCQDCIGDLGFATVEEARAFIFPPTFTADQIKCYLDNAGTACPFCYSSDIQGHSMEFESGSISQRISCGDCKKEWFDVYTLTGIQAA